MVGADIWFLNVLDMVGIETFSTLNPKIIINVSVNAILYQNWSSKCMGDLAKSWQMRQHQLKYSDSWACHQSGIWDILSVNNE